MIEQKIKKTPGRKPGGPKKSNAVRCAEYQQRTREKLARLRDLEALIAETTCPLKLSAK